MVEAHSEGLLSTANKNAKYVVVIRKKAQSASQD